VRCRAETMWHANGPGAVRVVSYNVLSPPLARPDHFPLCRPQDLESTTRLERVLEKLEPHIEAGVVVALQEVCLAWSGPLQAAFCQRGYHFFSSLYGDSRSDWIGVGLAWPASWYLCEALEAHRLADTKPTPWQATEPAAAVAAASQTQPLQKEEPPEPACATPRGTGCWAALAQLLCMRSGVTAGSSDHDSAVASPAPAAQQPADATVDPPLDPWAEAARRNNRLILAALSPLDGGGPAFCVATYHMPCLFGSTEKMQIMNIHASLAVKKLTSFADGRPCVLMGDFNVLPESSTYRLLTSGLLAEDEAELPQPRDGDSWKATPLRQRLRSAYRAALGTEPIFTNFAAIAGPDGSPEPPFCGTLDYVFVSDHWHVREVLPLPPKSKFAGPLPDVAEPSDHLLVGATLWPAAGNLKLASVPQPRRGV